jgi:hypothetical protein
VSVKGIIRCFAGPATARTSDAGRLAQGRRSNRPSAHHPIGSRHLRAPIGTDRPDCQSKRQKANSDSSNETQVRRILRDQRLFLASVYYRFIRQLLSEMAPTQLYLTIDEESHLSDFTIFGVALATDGMTIALGWLVYATDQVWAEDARDSLTTLADYLPADIRIIVLAERIHSAEPFLACLEMLGWQYVFRASADRQIETSRGWKALRQLSLQARRGRFLQQVRLWKSGVRPATISCYKLPRNGHRPAICYLVSSLPANQERFVFTPVAGGRNAAGKD